MDILTALFSYFVAVNFCVLMGHVFITPYAGDADQQDRCDLWFAAIYLVFTLIGLAMAYIGIWGR